MEEKKQQISATPKTYEQGYTEGWDAAIKAYRQPGAVWVKASSQLPGWKKRVKWRAGNDHSYATDGEISLFEMEKPNLEGWEWYDENPVEQPVVDNQDWSNFIPQMSNIQDRTGISIEWQKVWAEVENWYGDIKKKETGEQFLKRMQATYFTKTAAAGREESVQINREWINNALVEFALAYHRSTNKDIANDAAEYLDDKLKEAGVVYVLSVDESPVAGRVEDAVAFGEWLRTFDLLDKQNGHWVLESQVATTRLYKLFKQQKEK